MSARAAHAPQARNCWCMIMPMDPMVCTTHSATAASRAGDSDADGAALRAALYAAGLSAFAVAELQPLPHSGLAHDHWRLCGTGWLLRVPKQSQMRLSALENLRYQAACFDRAAASARVPRLLALLTPSTALPHGALVVEEISGRAARLPQDLPALIEALAALHVLPWPEAGPAPLQCDADPLHWLMLEIEAQAMYLQAAGVSSCVTQVVREGLASLARLCAETARPPRALISFDGHPGNFVVRADGTAVLVDLEKCRYAYAGLDLAHATLYTSTTWDRQSCAVLDVHEVAQAYRHWARCMKPSVAVAARPWHLPLRRAMWLWSLSWCAKWRVLSQGPARADADGEDWSVERSDMALIGHVRERVDHYLGDPAVQHVLAEFEALARLGDAFGAP